MTVAACISVLNDVVLFNNDNTVNPLPRGWIRAKYIVTDQSGKAVALTATVKRAIPSTVIWVLRTQRIKLVVKL